MSKDGCVRGFRLKRHGQVWPLVIWGGKQFNNLQLTFDGWKGMNNTHHYIQLCQSLFKQPCISQWPCIDRIDTSLVRKTCQMQSQQQMPRMLCKVMGLFDYHILRSSCGFIWYIGLLKICFLLIDLSWQRPFWTHLVAPSDTLTRTEQTCFMDDSFGKLLQLYRSYFKIMDIRNDWVALFWRVLPEWDMKFMHCPGFV